MANSYKTSQLKEVFGVSASSLLSYIERSKIDGKFKDALSDNDKHIVVYGASKQGKTALVSRHLPYQKNIVVRLTPNTNVEDIYSSILRQAGIEIETGGLNENTSEASASVGIKAKAKILFFGECEASASGAIKTGEKKQETYSTIPFNLKVAQDVAELLQKIKFDKKVILENFHYLTEETQRAFSFDLRSFQEMGIIFVILGVWAQKDKLRNYCTDLTDRVIDVPVEPWTSNDFEKVAVTGEQYLRLRFSKNVIQKCIENSFGSIGVFQELLKETCIAAGVRSTNQKELIHEVVDINFVTTAISGKGEQYCANHQKTLEMISSGNVTFSKDRKKIPLHLPYYLVRCILEAGYNGFKDGLNRDDITASIKKNHHRKNDVRSSDMSNLLHSLSSSQEKKGINPPLIDYDRTKRRLNAIDSTFLFFLKNCDLTVILDDLPSPVDL